MQLVVDEDIIYVKQAFSQYGDVTYLPGREISNQSLRNCDVLIISSNTKVNKVLLENTPVQYVGTVTSGMDHIDIEYLNKANIHLDNAHGINTNSVVEYITASLLDIVNSRDLTLNKLKAAIVGCGEIGSKVVSMFGSLGLEVTKIDPPLQRASLDISYSSFSEVFSSDIVSFHVPLITEGIDTTYHYLNEYNIHKLKKNCILINTSRGDIIDNNALLNLLEKRPDITVVLDVWENEPNINIELLKHVYIATPHIAGYSTDARIKSTKIIHDKFCQFIQVEPNWSPEFPKLISGKYFVNTELDFAYAIHSAINKAYFVKEDDFRMRNIIKETYPAKFFDLLRIKYPVRRECSNYSLILKPENNKLKSVLESLGFKIIE